MLPVLTSCIEFPLLDVAPTTCLSIVLGISGSTAAGELDGSTWPVRIFHHLIALSEHGSESSLRVCTLYKTKRGSRDAALLQRLLKYTPEPEPEPEPSPRDWPPAHSPSSSRTRPEANSCTSGSMPLHMGSSSRDVYRPCSARHHIFTLITTAAQPCKYRRAGALGQSWPEKERSTLLST